MYSRKYWIKEYIKRYEFISKFCHGKILNCKFSWFATYHSAKILLENGVNEVISYSKKENRLISYKIINKEIDFQTIESENKKFFHELDCIVSFETTFDQLNFEESVDIFSKFLKKNGKLIISIINEEKIHLDEFSDVTLSKEKFLEILEGKFDNVDLYSQRLLKEQIRNNSKTSSFRSIGANILKKIDKNRTFYINHFQNKMKQIDEKNYQLNKVPDSDFVPIKNMADHEPNYFIAICSKPDLKYD